MPTLIAIDWGTSAVRAWLMAADGHIIARRHTPQGILTITNGGFAHAFDELVAPWVSAHGKLPALACGMIGSRQGWTEAPYAMCPCAAGDLPERIAHAQGGRIRLSIVPGVARDPGDRPPEVMRGEETQVFGALAEAAADGVFVLPGTHSKWVRVEAGRIVDFATYMTGELFGLLRHQSILARTMSAGDVAHDADAWNAGVASGLSGDGELLHRLFEVRTLALFDRLLPDAGPSYLSGLLIGAEVAAARWAWPAPAEVTLIGDQLLVQRYAEVLNAAGVRALVADPDVTPRGLWRVAVAAGMIG
jgi:2-dehydro-3-deoxygalactonokinase